MRERVQAQNPSTKVSTATPTKMLQRKCNCNAAPTEDEEMRLPEQESDLASPAFASADLGHNFSRIRVNADGAGIARTKLEMSQPGDPYELEADSVADQVMRMAEPATAPPEQDAEAESDEEVPEPLDMELPMLEEGEEEESRAVETLAAKRLVQRKCGGKCQTEASTRSNAMPGSTASDASSVVNGHSGGKPLDAAARSFFEPRFGHRFDHVRVHTDTRAAESARTMSALAYTVGRDIVFGAGQYAPDTATGRRLLAHELTHVVQQTQSSSPAMTPKLMRAPIKIRAVTGGSAMLQRWGVYAPIAGINTIVCDGSGGITTQIGNVGNADATRCLSDCVEAHEQSHRADALAEKANICSGEASGRTVRPNAGAQRNATEIKASNAEIACIRPQIPRVGEVCKGIMERRITQMEAYRDSFK